VLVFSLVAHEYAHAAAALGQGDDTGYMLGRVTFNPIPHIDLWLSIAIPALTFYASGGTFFFGGAKPVPVNPRKYRNYRKGDLIVSAAGVVTNLVLVLVFAVLFVLLHYLAVALPSAAPTLDVAQRMATWGIYLNLLLGFFNLIPIPPLDGSHLLYHALPAGLGLQFRRLYGLGFLPVLALVFFFPAALRVLLAPVDWGYQLLTHVVAPFAVGGGWDIFQR
jgi:Zn-dependent protease